MPNSLSARLLRFATLLLLLVTSVLPYIGGDPGSYVIILVAVVIVVLDFAMPEKSAFDPASPYFMAAFLILSVLFAVTNRAGHLDVVYIVNFIMFVLFSPLTAGLLRGAGAGNARRVADIALLGTAIALGVAAFQVLVQHAGRAEGFESSPIRAATAALLLGFLALMGWIESSGPRRFLYLLGPLLGIGVVYLSQSRGPLLGVLPLLAVALLVIPKRRAAGIGALVVIAIGSIGALLFVPNAFGRIGRLPAMVMQLLSGQPVTDVSGAIRNQILQGSIQSFLQSPWIGYGWAGKTAAVDSHLVKKLFGHFQPYFHLHSDLLDFAVAGGIVGLIALALLYIGPIVSVLRSPRDSQFKSRLYGVLVIVVGYVFCGAVNAMIGFELMTTFYVCTLAILLGYCRDAGRPATAPARA